jgi:allantoin racemase
MPPQSSRYYDFLERHFAQAKRKDTEIAIRDVTTGYNQPEYRYPAGSRIFNDIELLKSVLSAEKEGFDGVSISCFLDPALNEARQLLNIPVTGLAESSLHLAGMMGAKFAVITSDVHLIPDMEKNLTRYGLEAKAIKQNPVRVLTLPEKEMAKIEEGILKGSSIDYTPLVDNFKEVASGCIEDGAEVLIMGCGLISPVLRQAGLTEVNGAAIIEPTIASIKFTELLVDLHKAKMPFISRKLSYSPVSHKVIAELLASRGY